MTTLEGQQTGDDWRASLRTVGTVFIIIGVLDIGYMMYCIARWQNYSSGLNISAVIAGVLLRRGSLRTAWWVTFFSAMGLGVALLIPIILVQVPRDLILTYVRLRLDPAVIGVVAVFAAVTFLVWTYRRLTAPAVRAAMEEHAVRCGRGFRRPSLGLAVGAVLVLALTLALSPYREPAKKRAQAQLDDDYKYFAYGLRISTGARAKTVSADIVAYNDDEIKQLTLTWNE